MTKEYLDKSGLEYFWGKIKDYVDAHGGGGTSPSLETITLTRVTQNYVNDTNFNRLVARKYGRIGILYCNLALNQSMANNTALTQIGTMSGYTPLFDVLQTIPCQSNNSTLLFQINTSGVISIGNYSGTATGTNFFRAMIPFITNS